MALRRLHIVSQHILQSRLQTVDASHFQDGSCLQYQLAGTLPSIIAEPKVALYDDKVKITLKDFPKNEKVTLHAQFVQGENKIVFASCGHYLADGFGHVMVSQEPSTGGTYTGVEPMGIIWSLQVAPGYPHFTRMAINFTEKPTVIHLNTYKGHLELEEIYQSSSQSPTSLATIELERWFRFPDVTRIEVEAGNVRGALYLPPGDGPFQGVIDMFGSSGGIIEYRAALLASRGFAALSLPYFYYKDLVTDMNEVTLDYFEEAVDWLSSHSKVFPHGIGVVAVSKGVEYMYAMTAYLEKVKCAVAINGFPFISIADLSHKGELLFKAREYDVGGVESTEEGIIMHGGMPYSKDVNVIPAWRGDAKHLILISEDDCQMLPECINHIIMSCPEEKRCNFEVVRYPGAGHLLEPPYTALCRSTINPTFGVVMLFGGQRKEHAYAQEDSWKRILNHLRTNIPMTS